jgi:hypothetical protein
LCSLPSYRISLVDDRVGKSMTSTRERIAQRWGQRHKAICEKPDSPKSV